MNEIRWVIKNKDVTEKEFMEERVRKVVSVDEELKDLKNFYDDHERTLKDEEARALGTLIAYMKRYTKINDTRCEITEKIKKLKEKTNE